MTSSLVGSEMCIRDRILTMPRVISSYPLDNHQNMVLITQGSITHRLKNNCLLYTSDAADDM
eukprot:5463620-Prorocentrum_lima.AAC.1